MRFELGGFTLLVVTAFTILIAGCGHPKADSGSHSDSNSLPGQEASLVVANAPLTASHEFIVPPSVAKIFKLKCHVCHGGAETKGGFDFKKMVYQASATAEWGPMDWRGATKIKLAILPVDGKPARMPKKAGSIWNQLTQEEANTIAAWTDYPFSQSSASELNPAWGQNQTDRSVTSPVFGAIE